MKYKIDTKKPNLFCLILLISFPSVAAVLISPALPKISQFYGVAEGYAQQLVTVFVIGYAFGQLIYSPFANRFGRKVTIYLGISLYIISCLVALAGIHYHNLAVIIWSRLFMAFGASVGMVISFTIINDFYHPEQSRPVVSYTVLAYSFMPALAIAIGGFITTHLAWQDCFSFYLAYGVFMLFISGLLPETLQNKHAHALKLKKLIATYLQAFSSPKLVLFSCIYGLMAAFIYVIASGAPFIGINVIGLTSSHYGVLLLAPYCGQFFGSLFAGKFSKQLSGYQILSIGYAATLFGSLAMFLAFIFHDVNAVTLFLPMFFIMLGLPMVYSTVTVQAMSDYEDKATGSAIMSFITMFISMLAAFTLTQLPQNVIIMPSLFLLIMAIAIVAFLFARWAYSDKHEI